MVHISALQEAQPETGLSSATLAGSEMVGGFRVQGSRQDEAGLLEMMWRG